MNNWQKVIYLNYGWVENRLIDRAISAPDGTTERMASLLGLEDFPYHPEWKKKGFVTVIRNNWDLLPKETIAGLLELTLPELESLLAEYDFLGEKLGPQPETDGAPVYCPLTAEEEIALKTAEQFTREHRFAPERLPFDFYGDGEEEETELPEKQVISQRFAASYDARYGGALDDEELGDYPEEYLARLKRTGTNGIWLSETLRHLAFFPFDPELSRGWEKRIANLKKLTERCARYGVDVYLYLNEPRSLPEEFFEKYPDMRGQQADDGTFCLCTAAEETARYLEEAFRSIGENVPLLKGIMTITMSENPTHCFSKPWGGKYRRTDCPRCRNRLPEEICAELNNRMARGLAAAGGNTRLIANLWGWSGFMGWTEEQALRGIDLLDPSVDVLCVSEYSKKFTRGGVASEVIDYSVSVVGPSDVTCRMLSRAKERGHRIWAKIQVNNSWECSAVPYLPAFDLMVRHVENVKKLGVEGLMMGWSLGGYPGGALPLCNLAAAEEAPDVAGWYRKTFGEDGPIVQEASAVFSRAFEEYPFSVDALYFGGQTLGPGNKLPKERQTRPSTMVCFSSDDYESYVGPYGIDGFLNQYEKLLQGWEKGCALLSAVGKAPRAKAFRNVAEAAGIHFESAYLLAKAAKWKRISGGERIVEECRERMYLVTEKLLKLMERDPTVGFEMTNHYYYNANLLLLRMMELKGI